MSYNNYEGDCIICFEPLKNPGQEIALLDCNHKYHLQCVKNWIQKSSLNNSCCICEKNNEIINIFTNKPISKLNNKKTQVNIPINRNTERNRNILIDDDIRHNLFFCCNIL